MPLVRKHTARAAADLAATVANTTLAVPCAGARQVNFRIFAADGTNPSAASIQVAASAAGSTWFNPPAGYTAVGAAASNNCSGAGYIMTLYPPVNGVIGWKYARMSITGHATNPIPGLTVEAEVLYDNEYAFNLGQQANEAAS